MFESVIWKILNNEIIFINLYIYLIYRKPSLHREKRERKKVSEFEFEFEWIDIWDSNWFLAVCFADLRCGLRHLPFAICHFAFSIWQTAFFVRFEFASFPNENPCAKSDVCLTIDTWFAFIMATWLEHIELLRHLLLYLTGRICPSPALSRPGSGTYFVVPGRGLFSPWNNLFKPKTNYE